MSHFVALFDLIGDLARKRHQLGEQSFATLGLNHTEARLLMLLHHEGGAVGQDVLSTRLIVDRTNVGRAIQSLEQGGFLLRQKSGTDRRANHVQITPKGRKAVIRIALLRRQIAETFFGDLQEADAAAIVQLLRKALPGDEGLHHAKSSGPAAKKSAAPGARSTTS